MAKGVKKSSVPRNLASDVSETPETEVDQINALKTELENLQDGLDEVTQESLNHIGEIDRLRDETGVRDRALSRAARALWIIPLVCLVLLLLSGTTIQRWTYVDGVLQKWTFSLALNPYAQTALIIAPIAMVGVILLAQLKGIFREKKATDDSPQLSREALAIAALIARMGGSGTP